MCRYRVQPLSHAVLGYLKVILALQPQPERGGVSEEAREQQCRLRCDRPLPVNDRVNPAWVYAYGLGQPILGDLHREQELFVENLSRVNGRQSLLYVVDIPHGRSFLVIVHNFDLIGVPFAPHEADAPLVVDADAELTCSISRERLQAIPRRRSQVVDGSGIVQHHQLHLRSALNIVRNLADTATFSDSLSVSVPVTPDHLPMIVCYTISVNC